MAAQFIGLTVLVNLSEPAGERVRGKVKDVGPGSQLTLTNGKIAYIAPYEHYADG